MRILITAIDTPLRRQVVRALRRAQMDVLLVRSGESVRDRVVAERPDCVVVDSVFDGQGAVIVTELKEDAATSEVPVIFVANAVEVADRHDYVVCGADDLLFESASALEWIAHIKLRTWGRQSETTTTAPSKSVKRTPMAGSSEQSRALLNRLLTDEATGLSSRAAFDTRLAEERKRARRYREALTLLQLNFGDDATEAWLDIARLLLLECRDIDAVCHVGKGTYAVLLPHTDAEGAETLASRLRERIAESPLADATRAVRTTVMPLVDGAATSNAVNRVTPLPFLTTPIDR